MKSERQQKTRYKLRPAAVAVALVVLICVGTLSIQAAPTCERVVKRYVEKLVPAHHTQRTLAAWRVWALAHPNYHPPKRRPRMTPKEVLEKVQFDCGVGTPTLLAENGLVPLQPAAPLPLIDLASIGTLDTPVSSVLPPEGTPVVVTQIPDGDVPEPSSWLLTMTGVAALLMVGYRRRLLTVTPALPANSL